ncbi:MAG: PmoA family protein [Pirellulales bacterium]|nr:PmoA family protein [Pirellulales bacterium]
MSKRPSSILSRARWYCLGLAVAAIASVLVARPASGIEARMLEKNVTFSENERPILDYRFADVPYKPYASKLYTPAGVNVLRDAPHDHLHHHGLMYALGVDDVDFWAEAPGDKPGRQVSRAIEHVTAQTKDGAATGRFSQRLDWLAADGRLMLRERRAIEVGMNADKKARLLTWRTRLETPPGRESVELKGHHYYGLGMRFIESMDRVGRRFSADEATGTTVRNDEKVIPARWMAYTAPADGKPVTVALFDHPNNPRHPAGMFSMVEAFAYLSATLNLHVEPLTLRADKPLDLCYGVALWDGEATPAEVERAYRAWVDLTAAK